MTRGDDTGKNVRGDKNAPARPANGVAAFAMDVSAMVRWMMQRMMTLFGLLIILIGIPLTPTPIPVGLPMIAIGLVILLNSSDTAKRAFIRWGRRYPETGRKVRNLMKRFSRRR